MEKRRFRKAPKRGVDGVVRRTKNTPLSLKKRTIQIEVSRSAFLRSRTWRWSLALALVSLCVIAVAYAPSTKAETNLYPKLCLGGWNDATRASGVPELDGSDASAYTSSNSASIDGTLAEIFCGSLTGEIPKDTQPTKLTLHFSWVLRADDHATIRSDLYASSTDQILDAPPETELIIKEAPTSTSEAPSESSPNASPQVPDPASSQDPAPATPDSAPQSMLRAIERRVLGFMAPIAHAQEIDASSSGPVAASPDPVGTSTGVGAPPAQASDSVAEIRYTLDGSTWFVLGVVDSQNLATASFDIPLDGIANWDDVSKLQISIRTLSGMPPDTTLYLDGIRLEVEYATSAIEKEKPKEIQRLPLLSGASYTEADLASVIVSPTHNDGSTSIIFYRDDNGAKAYMAETLGHGELPLSAYYSPLPEIGKYIMLEYDNDGGNFECSTTTFSACASDKHLIKRVDFDVAAPPSVESESTTTAATSSDTISPEP